LPSWSTGLVSGASRSTCFRELQKRYFEEPYVVRLLRPNREHSGALCLVRSSIGTTAHPRPEKRFYGTLRVVVRCYGGKIRCRVRSCQREGRRVLRRPQAYAAPSPRGSTPVKSLCSGHASVGELSVKLWPGEVIECTYKSFVGYGRRTRGLPSESQLSPFRLKPPHCARTVDE